MQLKRPTIVLSCVVLLYACGQDKVKIQLASCTPVSDSCISYAVPGFIFPIKQRYHFDCWATVLTMLQAWKDQKSYSVGALMASYGKYYSNLYNESAKEGIGFQDEIALYKKAGLELERQLDPSIKGWAAYLSDFGPLSITIDARPPFGGVVHALLIVGIQGSITGQHTTIVYVDPLDGQVHYEEFITFLKKYEAKYAVDWPIQIIHLRKK